MVISATWSVMQVAMVGRMHRHLPKNSTHDALMVSKYYGQLVRLLADYSSQWKLVMELDGYIRGNPPTVGGRIVWSVDQDDDLVSGFKYDIRANHQDAFRANAALSSRASGSQPRRSGAGGGSSS